MNINSTDRAAPSVGNSFKSKIVNHYQSTGRTPAGNESNLESDASQPLLQNHPSTYQAINGDVTDLVEQENLLETSQIVQTLHVYKRRWYMLAVFSIVAFLQGALCSVWSVITPSVEEVFQWTDQDISLMQIWIYLAFLVVMFPMAIFVDMKGLRYPTIVTCVMLSVSTGLRCITFNPPNVLWISHLAHIIMGSAAPLTYTAGPIISALWFPAHQRATATAISTIAGYAGGAACFLFGPMIVDAPHSAPIPTMSTVPGPSNFTNIEVMRSQIRMCRYIECAACVLVTLLVIAYFPSKPPRSPTLTSAIGKLNLRRGLAKLFSKEQANFWFICLAYCIPVSIYGVWNGLLGVNLKDLMPASEIGWLGFSGIMSGCVTAVILGRLSDLFTGHMKSFVLVMISGFTVCTFWFLLLSHNYIKFNTVQLYAAGILQGLFNNGAVPLYYELGIEATYPVAEICVATIMTFVYNLIPLLFLIIFFIPNVGTTWMDWLLFSSGILALPVLLAFKEMYKRSMVDKEGERIQENLAESGVHDKLSESTREIC